jgi:hypothetical protein
LVGVTTDEFKKFGAKWVADGRFDRGEGAISQRDLVLGVCG